MIYRLVYLARGQAAAGCGWGGPGLGQGFHRFLWAAAIMGSIILLS